MQAKWDADKAAALTVTSKAMQDRITENEAIRIKSVQDNNTIKDDYEKKIADLTKHQHHGLFLSKATACSGVAMPAAVTASGGTDDPAGSIRLPKQIEQDLRTLADDANVCAIRLRALQGWVIAD